jgi:hypothetical protein
MTIRLGSAGWVSQHHSLRFSATGMRGALPVWAAGAVSASAGTGKLARYPSTGIAAIAAGRGRSASRASAFSIRCGRGVIDADPFGSCA